LVTLQGKRQPGYYFRTDVMTELLRDRGGILIDMADETAPDFQVEEVLEEHRNDFIGAYIGQILKHEDKELAKKAAEYGLQALLTDE